MKAPVTFHNDVHAPARSVSKHRGEIIKTFRDHRGVTLHSWRGSSWAKRSKALICEDIDSFLDDPDSWTECAGCGHPLCLDEAVYADDDDERTACHEGGCADDYLTLAHASAWR